MRSGRIMKSECCQARNVESATTKPALRIESLCARRSVWSNDTGQCHNQPGNVGRERVQELGPLSVVAKDASTATSSSMTAAERPPARNCLPRSQATVTLPLAIRPLMMTSGARVATVRTPLMGALRRRLEALGDSELGGGGAGGVHDQGDDDNGQRERAHAK